MLVERNVDELIGLIGRAGKCGYNGVLLADYKFNILDRMPPNYFKNVERVRKAADDAGIEIVPAVFPIGYSSGLLAHDPNLAEGLPVRDAPFIARQNQAGLDTTNSARLVNGDLESARGDIFVGFSFQDDPGKCTFADHDVVHQGKTSCRMENLGTASPNCRLSQRVKVRPYACYRLSCWVKTQGLRPAGDFRLLALGGQGGRPLTFFEGGVKPTQDWTRSDVVFNSLDQSEVQVYAGIWGGREGKLWLDDFALEELGPVNVLRRAGCPFTFTSTDQKTVYEEGKDYLPFRDAKLGQVPYAGEYSFAHAAPALQLPEGSRIQDGQKLRVSWYHPILVHGEQVMCCLSDEKVYSLLRDQAKRVHELFKPRTFFLSHDEVRVAGWCKACQDSGRTPGDLLARNVRRCVAIIKEINPQARLVVWSDMFDPNHNAVDKYYLVHGTLEGSWKGLPEDVIIANWNSGKALPSLKFFADAGHEQLIAGYYDSGTNNFKKWDADARGIPKVTGFMYTTWRHNYAELEAYGKMMLGKE